MSLFAFCSWVGLITHCPSMRPMRTHPIGPMNGISLMCSAADAAFTARKSASRVQSDWISVELTCTSL